MQISRLFGLLHICLNKLLKLKYNVTYIKKRVAWDYYYVEISILFVFSLEPSKPIKLESPRYVEALRGLWCVRKWKINKLFVVQAIRLVLGYIHIRHAIVRRFDCEHEDLSTQGGKSKPSRSSAHTFYT